MNPLFKSSTSQPQPSGPFQSNDKGADQNSAITGALPTVGLPTGGGAIKGIEEKFNVNAITGTSSMGIPIPFSPGRGGVAPSFALTYNSGAGNGAFGLGWQMDIPSISRKTENGLPTYQDALESDTFIISGSEDLVPLLEKQGGNWQKAVKQRTLNGVNYTITQYRPRTEGSFARIEKWQNNTTAEVYWRTITRDNLTAYYGLTDESRLSDPADASRVFEWHLSYLHDDKGNLTLLTYKKEDFAGAAGKMNETNRIDNCTQLYLKKIMYGNKQPYYNGDTLPAESDFLFKTVFDYGEHDPAVNIHQNIDTEIQPWACRKDPFSSYRSGFEVRTYRRCQRIMMFHCFDNELPLNPYLVRSLQLFYDETLALEGNTGTENGFSFLVKIRQNGHLWDADAGHYSTKYLPETELQYQQHEWNTTVQTVAPDQLAGAPVGIDDKSYLWVDLFNEGIGGILTEQNNAWYYKSNLGKGHFTPAEKLGVKPSFSGLGKSMALTELEGDGTKYLVQMDASLQGFFKLNEEDEWEPMQYFENNPNVNPSDPNLRFIDLTGDRRPDILQTEDDRLRWYHGLGEKGFGVSQTVAKAVDEEKGPAIVFADASQSIFLADMSGDGLTDIVRIRNGEICYWPNKGYGNFGAKVNMDNAPVFDHSDNFNPSYLRLADIDGSGTIDVIYLGKNNFRVWMNQNGNEWSAQPQVISSFPQLDNVADVAVFDFLGTGTASIVYSSAIASQPLQYIDLMGSKKPALLIGYKNNCGKEVAIEYRSSTQYYLDDKLAGIPWITKLPFPVHCISRITNRDLVRETVFINTYSYRHGYYDFTEKEFRGFARVEQNDTESFADFALNAAKNVVEADLHQPPVKAISWFHTGAYLMNEKLLHQCQSEYFKNPAFTEYEIPEPILPDNLSPDELHEALRACKGLTLRTEVYSADGSAQQDFPYNAAQTNIEIKLVQPRNGQQYASFLVVPSESISYSYERNPADPSIAQTFTLDTDELGNILQAASVVYPRLQRPTGADAIPDQVWTEQDKLHIVCNEALYTNDISTDDAHRLRAGYENRSYELNGLAQPATFFFKPNDLRTAVNTAAIVSFEDEFNGSLQKRLGMHARGYFYKDDLSGPLALGQLSAIGITHKSYQLAFTPGLVTQHYGTKVTDTMLQDAKYVHSEGDTNWWTQPGDRIFPANPQDSFYMPVGSRDVFGNESHVEWDAYHLLIHTSTNALNHVTTAQNDYRVLNTAIVTDINQNRTAVTTDELGMVIKSAVMGKQGAGEGDTLDDPTVKTEYNLFNWQTNGKPNYVHTYAREKHGAANPRWQESFSYADGSGGAIMTKTQTNPGIAKKWDEATKTVININANPRWMGNGRTIVNNKGNVVKRYEPYFSDNFNYETESDLVETGVTAINYYDAVGRNIRTDMPNGTFSKVEFDTWRSTAYDANDTVLESQWYADRGSPAPADPEPADPETRAAWLAASHANTPARNFNDAIGRTIHTMADHGNGKTSAVFVETDLIQRFSKLYDQLGRNISRGHVNLVKQAIYTVTAEKGESWVFTDVMGRMVKTWDNDLSEIDADYDQLHRPVSTYVTQSGNRTLFSHIVYGDLFADADATAKNLKGKAYQLYDQSGVVTVTGVDFKGNVTAANRQLATEYKQLVDWSPLHGLTDITAIQLAAAPFLETEVFESAAALDALSRPITVVLPDHSVIRPIYNEANFLASLDVQIHGVGSFVNFLAGQDYDAKGQRQFAAYGNGTVTNYFYDPLTFRLTNLITKLHQADADTDSIQDLFYTFDPVGNITQIRDDAQQTHFFQNAVVYPEARYQYDALYQLVQATGREHVSLSTDNQSDHSDFPFINQLPEANNTTAVRNYTEKYEYDDCGNIKLLKHIANNANWNRRYQYIYETDPTHLTNRLKATSLPGDANGVFSATYTHNLHGNLTSMPHLSAADSMQWNFLDQLTSVNLGGGGMAYYAYTVNGQRTRKVIERQGGLKVERIYLGAVEIYRERQGNNAPDLERYTLHISDNTGNIAQVDTKTIDVNHKDTVNQLNQNSIRYQLSNHMGSATLETDDAGHIISYEEYHPFGTSAYRVSKPGTDFSLKRYRFSGKERDDETGFYYFGARYYAAWLGRWTSSDPGGFVSGFNLFKYCSNSPVLFQDPNGKDDNPNSLVGATPETEYLRDPSRMAEARAYLERVFSARLRDQTKNMVIDRMHFVTQTRSWSVDSFHLVDRPTATGDGDGTGDGSGDSDGEGDGDGDGTGSGSGTGDTTGSGQGSGDGTTGTGDGSSTQQGDASATPADANSSQPPADNPTGGGESIAGPAGERFIWDYDFPNQGIPGSRRGQILEWMYGNDWRSNTANYDIETGTAVQQIKSTDAYGRVGQTVRDATRDADVAITANPTGTMGGKSAQAIIITPTDAPASVDADIAGAMARSRRTLNNPTLPPEQVRGLPGRWGAASRGLSVVGTGLSAYSLYRDIRAGDAPMATADTLTTAGGGLEIYAFTTSGATVAGVSAASAGMVLAGAGIAIGSGISAYREFKAGDNLGGTVDLIGVAAGIAIVAGVVFSAPALLIGGAIAALGVGLFHLGRWLLS
ncbi:RHS repeat-associated protein [Mucilaginibacter yixingensis]|uniref:RHS repeat-associated protein n=1 Tax=Mucilaginibacter yixingensis TaxID=1295612 RepID=A0A2T5JBH9_9SPHI|nr:SpvB/TcaC N-terminal domain-containing protein [Mucilaginibacter yixingensis]PTQ98228.1 RHS repeat-associated protein [Mucilaginibacter yixingensis]